jgi:hypothetical protein
MLSNSKLTGLVVVAVLAGSPLIPRAQNTPNSLATLQRAAGCVGHMPKYGFGNPTPPVGTITMTNDGGWCWVDIGMMSGGQYYIPELRTLQAPQHGTILTGGVNNRVRFAYKPSTGFIGNDTVVVHSAGPNVNDLTFNVAVTR